MRCCHMRRFLLFKRTMVLKIQHYKVKINVPQKMSTLPLVHVKIREREAGGEKLNNFIVLSCWIMKRKKKKKKISGISRKIFFSPLFTH